jgi:hypothetical protein
MSALGTVLGAVAETAAEALANEVASELARELLAHLTGASAEKPRWISALDGARQAQIALEAAKARAELDGN